MRGISKTRRVQAQLNDFKNLGMDGTLLNVSSPRACAILKPTTPRLRDAISDEAPF
jgi:hypothetical protein